MSESVENENDSNVVGAPESRGGTSRAQFEVGIQVNRNGKVFSRPPFGNQTIIQPSLPAQRLTALRPCFATGLPLSLQS